MDLTTTDRYFELFPEATSITAKSQEVNKVHMRIKSVSISAARYLGRETRSDNYIEHFDIPEGTGLSSVFVKGFPIETVNAVYDGDEVVDSSRYVVQPNSGRIIFKRPLGRGYDSYRTVTVDYVGGMAESTADFIEKYPSIENSILDQVNFELKRVPDIAKSSIAQGNYTSKLLSFGLSEFLTAELDNWKRLS